MKGQQLAQDDGEQRGGDPGSADAFPPDHMVDGGPGVPGPGSRVRLCPGRSAGFRLLAATSWTVPPIKLFRIYLPCLLRLGARQDGRHARGWRSPG
jgi:hypothetical protein